MNINDLSTEDRATALVVWASRWDEFADSLSCDPFFDDHRILAVLTAAAGMFAHPLLTAADTLTELMFALRSAVNARDVYSTAGFLPDHIDEQIGDTYNRSQVEDLLDDDVDSALFPLLTGSTMPCWECKRTKSHVSRWQPATSGRRCEDHRLIAVNDGFGIGLVAS